MKKRRLLCTSILALALAGCEQPKPAEDAMQEGDLGTEMTIAQLVQTPGWQETAPGYWEREEDGFKQTVFVGRAATQRYITEQRQHLVQLQNAGLKSKGLARHLDWMQANLDAHPEK